MQFNSMLTTQSNYVKKGVITNCLSVHDNCFKSVVVVMNQNDNSRIKAEKVSCVSANEVGSINVGLVETVEETKLSEMQEFPSNRQTSSIHNGNDASSVDEDEGDEDTTHNESSSRFPLISIEGQMSQNPHYTISMATLSAKREYNRQNAARARKRAKTLLHTYQEQIQVLMTQVAQLRDQNRNLLATLQSLQEENISIHQSQQLLDERNRAGTTSQTVGSNAQAPTLDMNNNANDPSNQSLHKLLLLLYLAGVSVHQSSSQHQQQQQLPSLSAILPPTAVSDHHQQQQLCSIHHMLSMLVQSQQQQQAQASLTSNNYFNPLPQQSIPTNNIEPQPFSSRMLTQPIAATPNTNNPTLNGGDASESATTTSNVQHENVEFHNNEETNDKSNHQL